MITRTCWLTVVLATSCLANPSSTATPASSAYQLAKGDVVRVEVFQEPELTTASRLDADGRFRMPLLGNITLAGKSVTEAQELIATALRDGEFIRSAHVTVRVDAYALREVLISGQVRSPGSYPLPAEAGMSVVELVAKAGGLTDLARGTGVTITRILPSGEKQVNTVDLAALIRGKGDTKSPSLQLEPGDLVFVPERIF